MKKADVRTFSGQYMQVPSSEDDAVFKRAWFKFYPKVPARIDQAVIAFDFAIKDKTTADYTVGLVMARSGGEYYVLDMVRDKMDFPTACQAVISLCSKWRAIAHKKIIEDKANGSAVVDTLKKMIPGLVLTTPTRDKMFRAQSITCDVESGSVFLPQDKPWTHDFLNEVVMFPTFRYDDIVDCMVYCISELRKGGNYGTPLSGHGSGTLF
jgi:predicted phage terminase large subunit-like protein